MRRRSFFNEKPKRNTGSQVVGKETFPVFMGFPPFYSPSFSLPLTAILRIFPERGRVVSGSLPLTNPFKESLTTAPTLSLKKEQK